MEANQPGNIQAGPGLTSPHTWVVDHADYLYNFALARLEREESAKDLVQETFLAALENLNTFQGKSTERTWLTSILKNKIIDIYRKKASGLTVTISLTSDEKQGDEDFFDPETGHWTQEHSPGDFAHPVNGPLHTKEFNTVLQICLKKLPSLWQAVFTLKHLDDTPTENICRDMKISSANFWVIIHRAKINLRACLQKNWI